MDINKIFKTQAQLDAHIMDKHPEIKGGDNISWKVLALLVELGECANEWRGFKKWSNDQKPRTEKKVICHACNGKGVHHLRDFNEIEKLTVESCLYCEGTGWQENRNPLLEEYVDGLHFIVSIGIELSIIPDDLLLPPSEPKDNVQDLFISLYQDITLIDLGRKEHHYKYVFIRFMELGLQLGFTFAQIENAYYAKNQINHERQDNGY